MTSESLLSQLRDLLGDRVSTSAAVRDHHSGGESHHAAVAPDAVVCRASTAEVPDIVAACAEHLYARKAPEPAATIFRC